MSNTFNIPAELREDCGKGASRRLRKAGLVPGILYGSGKDAVALQMENKFMIKALEDTSFYTSILEIKVGDGRRQKVILRDLQRHPYKPVIMHMDFQRISDTEKMHIKVPLHFDNEDTSPAGKQSGVVISHQVTEVEIVCLPSDLPEFLQIDLAELDAGEIRHLSDVVLPEGVEVVALSHGDDQIVVSAQHVAEQTISDEAPEAPDAEVPTTSDEEEKADDADEADGE